MFSETFGKAWIHKFSTLWKARDWVHLRSSQHFQILKLWPTVLCVKLWCDHSCRFQHLFAIFALHLYLSDLLVIILGHRKTTFLACRGHFTTRILRSFCLWTHLGCREGYQRRSFCVASTFARSLTFKDPATCEELIEITPLFGRSGLFGLGETIETVTFRLCNFLFILSHGTSRGRRLSFE